MCLSVLLLALIFAPAYCLDTPMYFPVPARVESANKRRLSRVILTNDEIYSRTQFNVFRIFVIEANVVL